MKKSCALIPFVACLAFPALAADSYTIDARHTIPTFSVNHLGFSTQHGRFDKSSGKIMLDWQAKKGSVDLHIDANSLSMGAADWDKHMKSADFFNVEKYPSISFKSDKLLFDGYKVIGAEGKFTLHGVTLPLTLKVSNFRCGEHPMTKKDHCGAEVSASIKRSEFGMGAYVPMVGDEISIVVPVEASKD